LLELIAEINVGLLQEIGRSHNPCVALTVESKPVDWNPAHAEIPQTITRGLANKILPKLKLHPARPPNEESSFPRRENRGPCVTDDHHRWVVRKGAKSSNAPVWSPPFSNASFLGTVTHRVRPTFGSAPY